jgi:hypothetical protein
VSLKKFISEYFNLKAIIACDSITEFQIAIATKVAAPNDIQLAAMAENMQIAWVTVIYNKVFLN